MIIVVAWALLIWLIMLLAFGSDVFRVMSGRQLGARDERRPGRVDQSRAPASGGAQDPVAR